MANSSDWLTALLDRPDDDRHADVKPVSWLSDLAVPNNGEQDGFLCGLPFDRPIASPQSEEETSLSDGSDDMSGDMIGDDLVDILREALSESENADDVPSRSDEPTLSPAPDPIEEAFARGEAAGRQTIVREQEACASQKLDLRQTFRALDQAAMDALAGELAGTVIALCSQTLADFIPAPDALKNRCLEAAQRLGSGAGNATLYLHPDDLLLIDKAELGSWNIVGDPATERGGLRFETEDGSISDNPADWRRAIAAAIRG